MIGKSFVNGYELHGMHLSLFVLLCIERSLFDVVIFIDDDLPDLLKEVLDRLNVLEGGRLHRDFAVG